MNGTQTLKEFKEANHEQASTGLIACLFSVIKLVERPCIVCFRVRLEHPDVAALLSLPLVEGVILESEDRELLAAFPHRLGYYIKSGTDWQLPMSVAVDMVYVGIWNDFGARVAWLAWLAGIRRIHNASAFQSFQTHGTFRIAVDKSLRSVYYYLRRSKLVRNTTGLLRVEQFLFSRKLRIIEGLPLPIAGAPNVWQKGKVVMVGGSLGPGGAERQIMMTLLGLFARGYRDLHFLHHSPMQKPNDFFLPQLIEAGIPFSQVDQISRHDLALSGIGAEFKQRLAPLGDLGNEVAAYANEFLVRRPEIVHIWLDHMNVVAGLAALLAGVPKIILSCRSLSPVHFDFIQPYMHPIYQFLAKFSNVTFLNNSHAGAADYGRWLSIKSLQIRVIRNGFDFSTLPPSKDLSHLRSKYRRYFGIPADAPVVGVIMRIAEEKRPFLWIEIARQVALKNTDAHFLIVGDGPMRKQAEALAQQALPDRIHFPGNEKNVLMAIAAMDLFLLTSRIEGLPNVLLEAQVIGVPPITIDSGGAKETIKNGESGWVISTSRASDIADRVSSLLDDKWTLELASRSGKEFVRTEFSRERMIDQTLHCYGINNYLHTLKL
jgi:glycosyltransferase involved in cell wall biosynthesis